MVGWLGLVFTEYDGLYEYVEKVVPPRSWWSWPDATRQVMVLVALFAAFGLRWSLQLQSRIERWRDRAAEAAMFGEEDEPAADALILPAIGALLMTLFVFRLKSTSMFEALDRTVGFVGRGLIWWLVTMVVILGMVYWLKRRKAKLGVAEPSPDASSHQQESAEGEDPG